MFSDASEKKKNSIEAPIGMLSPLKEDTIEMPALRGKGLDETLAASNPVGIKKAIVISAEPARPNVIPKLFSKKRFSKKASSDKR